MNVAQLYIAAAVVWLCIFLFMDIRTIIQGKRVTDAKSGLEEEYPLKNLFAVFMLGYVTMEMTSI